MSNLSMILVGAGAFVLLLLLPIVISVSKKVFARTPGSSPAPVTTSGWRKDLIPHLLIGGVITAAGLLFYDRFQFSLFLGIVAGAAMLLVGSKLAKLTSTIAKTWGNILYILGWVVIVIALWNSGARLVAERGITKIDRTLTEIGSGGEVSSELPSWISGPKSNSLEVDFRGVEFGKTQKVLMGVSDTVTVLYASRKFERGAPAFQEWGCPKSLGIPLMFEKNTRTTFVLTEESKADLLRQHSLKVDILVTSTKSPWHGQGVGSDNPCPYLKMN
jgi:hypothetical protein